jgi:hypothetical protein
VTAIRTALRLGRGQMHTYRNEVVGERPWTVGFKDEDGFHPINRFSNEKDAVALVNHLNGGAPLALSEAGLAEFEKDVDDD